MTVVKWSPIKELENIRLEMERLFAEVVEPFPKSCRKLRLKTVGPGDVGPRVEMFDGEGELVVRVELPGVDKEDIAITVTQDVLTISGEKKRGAPVDEDNYHISEIRYGPFARTVTLPAMVKSEEAKAKFRNGILEIVIPRQEETKPKGIKIGVS